jgi:hypothetical protein
LRPDSRLKDEKDVTLLAHQFAQSGLWLIWAPTGKHDGYPVCVGIKGSVFDVTGNKAYTEGGYKGKISTIHHPPSTIHHPPSTFLSQSSLTSRSTQRANSAIMVISDHHDPSISHPLLAAQLTPLP